MLPWYYRIDTHNVSEQHWILYDQYILNHSSTEAVTQPIMNTLYGVFIISPTIQLAKSGSHYQSTENRPEKQPQPGRPASVLWDPTVIGRMHWSICAKQIQFPILSSCPLFTTPFQLYLFYIAIPGSYPFHTPEVSWVVAGWTRPICGVVNGSHSTQERTGLNWQVISPGTLLHCGQPSNNPGQCHSVKGVLERFVLLGPAVKYTHLQNK